MEDTEEGINPDTVIPLICGFTNNLHGHVRIILPKISSCFECSELDLFGNCMKYDNLSNLAYTPRIPEHCIKYACYFSWFQDTNEHRKNYDGYDKNNNDHIQWIYEAARKFAEQRNIEGVTYRLTLAIIQNTIPSFSPTTSIIAGMYFSFYYSFVLFLFLFLLLFFIFFISFFFFYFSILLFIFFLYFLIF